MIQMYRIICISILIISMAGGVTVMASEEPEYKVLKKYDQFEIREYSAYLVAETEVSSTFQDAGNIAFRILFDYISGNNVKQEKIKMTAPVHQKNTEDSGEKIEMTAPVSQKKALKQDGSYILSFVVPSKYTLETVPVPKDDRVSIREIPTEIMAVRRYSGSWKEKNYRRNETILMEALEKNDLEILSDPVSARYNPPFWPPFLKRNEVMAEIRYSVSE